MQFIYLFIFIPTPVSVESEAGTELMPQDSYFVTKANSLCSFSLKNSTINSLKPFNSLQIGIYSSHMF